MKLGVFAKTYDRKSLEATLDAVKADGLSTVQLKMTQVGLPTLPDAIPAATLDRIRRATESRGIEITAISATFNMAHPDPAVRQTGVRRLAVLARAAQKLHVPVLSLCSGTRNLDDIWAYHIDNELPDAWDEMYETVAQALDATEATGVHLAIEPEPGNIVVDAACARDLIHEIDNPRLGAIIDPANLLSVDGAHTTVELLAESISLLGEYLLMVHAKDLSRAGFACAPGKGIVQWDRFLAQLQGIGFDGPVLMHGFDEAEVPSAVAFLSPIIEGLSSTPDTTQS